MPVAEGLGKYIVKQEQTAQEKLTMLSIIGAYRVFGHWCIK